MDIEVYLLDFNWYTIKFHDCHHATRNDDRVILGLYGMCKWLQDLGFLLNLGYKIIFQNWLICVRCVNVKITLVVAFEIGVKWFFLARKKGYSCNHFYKVNLQYLHHYFKHLVSVTLKHSIMFIATRCLVSTSIS